MGSFIAHIEASARSALPRIIRDEFDFFLECGILAHRFLRLRCGWAAVFNTHLHCPVLDGVYRCGADGAPVFVEVGVPTDDEVHARLQTFIARLVHRATSCAAATGGGSSGRRAPRPRV